MKHFGSDQRRRKIQWEHVAERATFAVTTPETKRRRTAATRGNQVTDYLPGSSEKCYAPCKATLDSPDQEAAASDQARLTTGAGKYTRTFVCRQ